jgi:hypothetical protein
LEIHLLLDVVLKWKDIFKMEELCHFLSPQKVTKKGFQQEASCAQAMPHKQAELTGCNFLPHSRSQPALQAKIAMPFLPHYPTRSAALAEASLLTG